MHGADIVLLPDNDPAGREHVELIAESLAPIARRLRILELPNLPEKRDVVDWHAAGGTAEGHCHVKREIACRMTQAADVHAATVAWRHVSIA